MYLCELAIVSQLCISFPYVLHGLCEDYLTCDIAFNAVMPPSRASTRGRYSRIEGVSQGDKAPARGACRAKETRPRQEELAGKATRSTRPRQEELAGEANQSFSRDLPRRAPCPGKAW